MNTLKGLLSTLLIFIITALLTNCSNVEPLISLEGLDYEPAKNLTPQPQIAPVDKSTTKNLRKNINKSLGLIYTLSKSQVVGLLGSPRVVKDIKTSQVWQYRGACVLNIVWEKVKNPSSSSRDLRNYEIDNPSQKDFYSQEDSNYTLVWLQGYDYKLQNIDPKKCFAALMNAT